MCDSAVCVGVDATHSSVTGPSRHVEHVSIDLFSAESAFVTMFDRYGIRIRRFRAKKVRDISYLMGSTKTIWSMSFKLASSLSFQTLKSLLRIFLMVK